MRLLVFFLPISLAAGCAHGRHFQGIVNHNLYQFPPSCVIHRVGWLDGANNLYQLTCNGYIKIDPVSSDTSENNRLPRLAKSFFTATKVDIDAADLLILDLLPILAPDSKQWIIREIIITDRYYIGYVNKRGERKVLVLFDTILGYDGTMTPSVFNYLVPISVNLMTKKIFFVRDKSGSSEYLAED
jgi:hypothetical protein